jgi:hypothetical protein
MQIVEEYNRIEEAKIHKIVSTFVCASSQGQHIFLLFRKSYKISESYDKHF